MIEHNVRENRIDKKKGHICKKHVNVEGHDWGKIDEQNDSVCYKESCMNAFWVQMYKDQDCYKNNVEQMNKKCLLFDDVHKIKHNVL